MATERGDRMDRSEAMVEIRRLPGGRDGEGYVVDPLLQHAQDMESVAPEHRHHLAVLGQHIGFKGPDALFSGHVDQSPHKDSADPLVLKGVLHHQGHLGGVSVGQSVVAAKADNLLAVTPAALSYEGETVVVVNGAEADGVLQAELLGHILEAEILGALAEPPHEVQPLFGIFGSNRAKKNNRAVFETIVRFVFREVEILRLLHLLPWLLAQ